MLHDELAELLGVDAVDDDADLFELGIQSLQLMRLATRLQRTGVQVTFAELAADPRLTAWRPLLTPVGPTSGVPSAITGADPPTHEGESFPLTKVQQAYWVGRRDDQPLGGVGCHAYLELAVTDPDPARLEAAVRALFARHPMLRATFDDEGRQHILPVSPWPGLALHDLRGHSADAAEDGLLEIRERLSHRRFDIAFGAVFDVQLSLLPGGAARVHVDVDLLVADVHSIRLLLDELARGYADPESIAEQAPSFADHTSGATPEVVARAHAYWAERIPGLPSGPALPLALDPATVVRPRFRRHIRTIEPACWQTLRQRARSHGITPAVLLATAFAEVLCRWSGSQRFLLNVPLFDRDQDIPELAEIVGDFTSLTLLEIDLAAADSFLGRARSAQARLHQDIGHAAYTGVDVLREVARADGDAPRSAPVVFACNIDAPLVSDRCAEVLGELAWMVSQTPQVWLDHQLYLTRDGGLELAWDAVDELFHPGVVEHMLDAYHALLRGLVDGDWSATPVISLPESQLRVREKVNSAARPHSGRRLHERFFELAARTPDAPALLFGVDGMLSYGELAERALRIGSALFTRGIDRGDAVVVTLPKGPDQIAAVLGILASGAAYVPVGVDQPSARKARITEVSGARLILTDAADEDVDAEVLTMADALEAAPLPWVVPGEPGDLAYVIFTSGTTGVPKGVEIDHQAAVNTIEDVNERFVVTVDDRTLAISALDFDLSVWDVFGLLSSGGALVLVDEADRRDAQAWSRLCARHGVTVWNSVPALMEMLLTATEGGELPASLRLVLLSGDWIGLTLPARLAKATAGRCELVALGGATEGAIWSNAFEVDQVPENWSSIPYGRPLRNQRYRVVDPTGRDCPDWVTGELWIGGDGVALGYRGAPELTRERFVQHAGLRWYRTGDLGCYWPDGTLEFLGRLDHQVKVNGNRVELGEVESVLATHPAVANAVVVTAGPAGAELHAALVARPPVVAVATLDVPAPANSVLADLAVGMLAELVADGAAGPGVAPEVFAAWRGYLAGRVPGQGWEGVLSGGTGELRAIVAEILRARPLLAMVAAGTAEPSVLADDPVLSVDGLADALPGTRECVGAAVRVLATTLGGKAKTVDWSGRKGRLAGRVLRASAGRIELTHTVLVSTPAEFGAATSRLAGVPGDVRVALRPGTAVTQEHLHAYDAVLAQGLLNEPGALAVVASLLRPGGTVLGIEQVACAPLALMLDGLATGVVPRNPEPSTWATALAAAGLAGAHVAHTAADGTVLLVAHRPEGAPVLEPTALRAWLADRLPDHMVPRAVVALPELPLSANGKVDRRRLKAVLATASTPDVASDDRPSGPTEEALAALWTRVLGSATPGRGDAFFALGGDSLLATRLVARIRTELGAEIAMRDILRGPTLAAMASTIDTSIERAREADAGMEEGEL